MLSLKPLDHKIWGIAWPAILSNLSIPLLGLIDAAILGHLGSSHYLGAVALGAAILSFLYWGFSFLRMGTTGPVAKAMGAGDHSEAFLILAQSAVLALVLAGLVIVLHPLWLNAGFNLMAPQSELLPSAESYARLRIISAPAVLVTYAIVGWYIGQQNTRWPMYIMVLTNVVNIALDFALIIGLGLNSDGAAIATVISEYLGCALALWSVSRRIPAFDSAVFNKKLRSLETYRVLLQSNRHLFVRTTCLLFSFAFFTSMGDKLGSDVLAANALLIQLLMLAAYGMDGFAFAAEGLVGHSLGSRNLTAFKDSIQRCTLWCGVAAIVVSTFFLIAHPLLISLLTDIDSVQAQIRSVLPWLIFLPIIAAPSYLLDGVFIGAANTRPMMFTMLLSTLAVYLPAWYFTQPMGNHGLWLAFTLFNGARGVTLYTCYIWISHRGGWLK